MERASRVEEMVSSGEVWREEMTSSGEGWREEMASSGEGWGRRGHPVVKIGGEESAPRGEEIVSMSEGWEKRGRL